MTIAAIVLDRLLAVSLHPRYQVLVMPKRVEILLTLLWVAAALGASVFISLHDHNDLVAVVSEVIGFAVTTAAFFRIHKVVRFQQNQIQCQLENRRAVETTRVKRLDINTLHVYPDFLAC